MKILGSLPFAPLLAPAPATSAAPLVGVISEAAFQRFVAAGVIATEAPGFGLLIAGALLIGAMLMLANGAQHLVQATSSPRPRIPRNTDGMAHTTDGWLRRQEDLGIWLPSGDGNRLGIAVANLSRKHVRGEIDFKVRNHETNEIEASALIDSRQIEPHDGRIFYLNAGSFDTLGAKKIEATAEELRCATLGYSAVVRRG